MIEQSAYGIVVFACFAGIATFFAPCAYALLPGYVGYYIAATGSEQPPLFGTIIRGLAAAVGSLGTFAIVGGITLVASNWVEQTLPSLEYGVGIGFIVLGGWILLQGSGVIQVVLPKRRATILGFGFFGAIYALAAVACVLPLFLAFTIQAFTISFESTIVVLVAYGVTFALLMTAVTILIGLGYSLGVDRIGGSVRTLLYAAGLLLIGAGIAQLVVARTGYPPFPV